MKKLLRKKMWKKGKTKYGTFMFNLVEKLNSDGYLTYPKGNYHLDRKGDLYRFKV
ncbi:hypothetical protein OZL92_17390 [Bacillus sonorensis]|uniref:Uncharacterized protein n=1 Tax=Bacillus sonorensis L12 TaxID=1274524 RepID=M5NWB2_9BACI|nr:hypothetical protein [Bacillus sonorensis]EME72211.1 hypothetical protein BSONL12_22975 [Bacillus sonorensis L12]MCZ0075462.1 hypothetical protein [Bacillus sonorensis]MCZ0093116.1 hypothetical protein [Bacillus sonorensis]